MADERWDDAVTDVIASPIDKVWPILADFDGFQRNFPQILSSCDTVEGEKNKVGSLRALSVPRPDGKGKVEIDERLIHLDDVNHTTSYVIEKNGFGWTGYKATIVAKSTEDGQTSVVWSFGMNPSSGLPKEAFLHTQHGLFQGILNLVKEKMKE